MTKDQRIYKQIFQAIVEQRLPPGTKLGEEALCEVFGVTRPHVRKGLLRLAHDRLIDLQPNRGAFVAQPSPKEAQDVFVVRRLLEPPMLAAVARAITPGDVASLRDFVEAERETQLSRDRQTAIRMSGEFHLRLAQIAGNEVLVNLLRQLVSRTSLIIAMYETPGASGCNSSHHGELLSLLEGGDVEAASALMIRHLEEIEQSLRFEIRDSQPLSLAAILAPGGSGDLVKAG